MINGKYRTFMVAILFFLIVTLFFYLLIVGVMPKYKTVSSKEDIATTDMAESYICLDASLSECYMGRLYSPEDFEKGILTQGDADAKYATNRITVPVEPGKTYGITGQSATYAQKVYVNGRLLSEIGCVSDNETDFVPKTDRYTVYFTADSDKAEIIIQNAWFNHVSGAFHKIYMAQQQVIIRHDRAETLCDGLITGTLLAMTIFFFGMFLFYQSRRSMLWFSLSCLCAAVHYLIYESKQIMVFFPDLNWYVGHKLEYITNSYYFLFMALFAASMLKLKFNKNFVKVTSAFVIALTLYYIIAPSQQYTKYIVPISGAVILYDIFVSIYMFYTALKRKLLKRWENIVVCMTVFLTAAV